MEKLKNVMKKIYKHVGLCSIGLLIVLMALHLLLSLVHIKFRKWVYVTVIALSLLGFFIKILQLLHLAMKKYKKDFFIFSGIIIVALILLGIIFWRYVLLGLFIGLLMVDSMTDDIMPDHEHVMENMSTRYVASVNSTLLNTDVDYYAYINFFLMGNEVKYTEYYNGSYDPIQRRQEKAEETKKSENTTSNVEHSNITESEDTSETKKFKKISEENLLYEKTINENIIIRVGKVGNAIGGKMGIEIQKTTDGGKTWQNQIKSSDACIEVNNGAEIMFISEKVGFIDNKSLFMLGEENASLLVTVNGGESFKEANFVFPEEVKDNAFYVQGFPTESGGKLTVELFAPTQIGMEVGNYYKFVSVDNGLNWTSAGG